jgi:hypothetical protein
MTNRTGISRIVAGAVVSGALSLTSVFGAGPAHADSTTYTEFKIYKFIDKASWSDVDGRDFLVWQKAPGATEEDVAMYYNKIAFQYATTTDSQESPTTQTTIKKIDRDIVGID